MSKRLVIFDFCETLFDLQTADKFIDFVIENVKYRKYNFLTVLTNLLVKLRVFLIISILFPGANLLKRLKLYQLRGISQTTIQTLAIRYYEEILVHRKISILHEVLRKHIVSQDHILVVSGGYSPYVKYFSEVYKIQHFFATEIEFHNCRATGKFNGSDCLNNQKVRLIEAYLKNYTLFFDETIAYSDSISDLPLLCWADQAYVVSKNISQKWSREYGFNEIVWKN
jgi:HAD superfamily phosphoserine phosphatase-like hydrolase